MRINYSIIPTILAPDVAEIEGKLKMVKGICPIVQIDFCDGLFVGNKTWPYFAGDEPSADTQLPFSGEFDFEFDLMIENPDIHVDSFLEMNPARVIFHIESTSEDGFLEAAEKAHEYESQIGIASSNLTNISIVKERAHKLESLGIKPFIQVMGIDRVGFKGQPFDGRSLIRIAELRREFPELDISVDGSVNAETLPKFKNAGANRFVVGSALFMQKDIKVTLKKLQSLIK